MNTPKYKITDTIIGRIDHMAANMPNVTVMIEIESARYDSLYGHWIYQGCVPTSKDGYVNVEIYEHDIVRKLR
jgi:hypothetical protein